MPMLLLAATGGITSHGCHCCCPAVLAAVCWLARAAHGTAGLLGGELSGLVKWIQLHVLYELLNDPHRQAAFCMPHMPPHIWSF
jgi:hypothetical protein